MVTKSLQWMSESSSKAIGSTDMTQWSFLWYGVRTEMSQFTHQWDHTLRNQMRHYESIGFVKENAYLSEPYKEKPQWNQYKIQLELSHSSGQMLSHCTLNNSFKELDIKHVGF